MTNQLSTLLADMSEPLQSLLSTENSWCWTENHQQAFQDIITELLDQVLAFVTSRLGYGGIVSCRAWMEWYFKSSCAGTGNLWCMHQGSVSHWATLRSNWKGSLRRNLGMWAIQTLPTDHKPLIALLGHKWLDELTARIQCFYMKSDLLDIILVSLMYSVKIWSL